MHKLKLSDAQRIVLAAAGARDTGLVLPLSKSVASNQGTASRILRALLDKNLIQERAVADGEPVWRGEADERTTLAILPAGLEAVGIAASAAADDTMSSKPRPRAETKSTKPKKLAATGTARAPKPQSKLGLLLASLRGKKGATIEELTKATGWQPHSVRGAISGALKKKLGLKVESEATEARGRVYRIAN